MSDAELIARLRDFKKVTVWEVHDAADRIEALQKALKDQSSVSDRLAEQLATCEKYRDAYDEMGRIGTQAVRDLEAKLAKTVEVLEQCEIMLRLRGHDEVAAIARTILAEIKGESHE